jgi:hypothetical protein
METFPVRVPVPPATSGPKVFRLRTIATVTAITIRSTIIRKRLSPGFSIKG